MSPSELPCPGCGAMAPVVEFVRTRHHQTYTVACRTCPGGSTIQTAGTAAREEALALAHKLRALADELERTAKT